MCASEPDEMRACGEKQAEELISSLVSSFSSFRIVREQSRQQQQHQHSYIISDKSENTCTETQLARAVRSAWNLDTASVSASIPLFVGLWCSCTPRLGQRKMMMAEVGSPHGHGGSASGASSPFPLPLHVPLLPLNHLLGRFCLILPT